MNSPVDKPASHDPQLRDYRDSVEKQLLALDALSKLYRQFASKPEFYGLVQTLLLTLSGQFAVTSAFALLRRPGAPDESLSFKAIGRFKQGLDLEKSGLCLELKRYLLDNPQAVSLDDINIPADCYDRVDILKVAGVKLICPVIHNDSLLGVIGLGERVAHRPFEPDDISLLNTLIGTNTPLLVSSYHFWEMTSLSAWYLDILNNVKQGVFVFDSENRLRKANLAAIDILQRFVWDVPDVVELDGREVSEIFPEDTFPGWSRLFIESSAESPGSTIDDLVARLDGEEYIYEGYVTGIAGGAEFGTDYIVTLDDVTDRKRTERERRIRFERIERQKEAINRLAMEDIMESGDFTRAAQIADEIISGAAQVDRTSIWLYDEHHTKLECIDLFDRRTGLHTIGRDCCKAEFPNYFTDLKKGRVVEAYDARTDPRWSEFLPYVQREGITSMLDAAIRVSGEIVGVVCQEHTGPPRRWESDELRFATEVAEHVAQALALAERKKLDQKQRELKERLEKAERMESLGILAGGVAHDLNNMLGPLVGYPELILRKIPEDSPFRKQIQRIGNAARDAADVIQDLLTLARRGRYEMRPTNLNEVIETYLDSPGYSQLIEKYPGVTVNVDLDNSAGAINGSAPHLSKVVMNLIINAFDAMSDTGTLQVSTARRRVERLTGGQQMIEPGEYVILSVRDSGSGISEEDINKIFEPYYSKKKMGRSGSGLGLSVVYGIVKDHGAYYDIQSKLGEGTEFSLYFPVAVEDVQAGDSDEADMSGTERVLVVDDVAEQREIASDFLSSLGYSVTTVASGQEAIEHLKDNRADIILMDMILETEPDGLDTYRKILELHPRQKALIISGYSATERVEEMQRLGAGAYIKKPFSLDTIGNAIREELKK